MRSRLSSLVVDASICHIHGIWEPHCAITSGLARKLGRPYVISAHGMLDPWALRQKPWKKRIYSQLLEFRSLSSAACLRALTANEAEQYRQFGLKNPIVVIPNGVEVPLSAKADVFEERYPHLRGKRIVLFMGRLHTKKGLIPLCRCWSGVASRFPDAHLVIAGPDSEGIEPQLRKILADCGGNSSVTFTGLLAGDVKWSAYASANLFILPSYSEGFSVAILESLGTGTPVAISHNCYFPDVPAAGAGWLTGVTESEIDTVLSIALNTPAAELAAMGRNGAKLVADKYSWIKVASQFAELYDWILGGNAPASFAVL